MTTSADGRWHPGIGDPNATGWITVVAYLAAAALCAVCATRESAADRRRIGWVALTVLMLLLGLNKQLDLQTWFTEIGRDAARAGGWYARRQTVQAAFIAALALAGVVGLGVLGYAVRGFGAELRWSTAGLLFLAVFVVVRATSFHHVDHLLGLELGGRVRLNAAIELTGIAIIAGAAAARLWRARSS